MESGVGHLISKILPNIFTKIFNFLEDSAIDVNYDADRRYPTFSAVILTLR